MANLYKTGGVLSFAFTLLSIISLGQDIVSAQNGAWNAASTWVGGVVPNSGNSNTITINHSVTVPNGFSVTIEGTTVSPAAVLTVASGGTLDIAPVPGALSV